MKTLLIKVSDEKTAVDILTNALQLELRSIIVGLQRTRSMLRNYEQKYNMKSKEFYKKFMKGVLEEKDEFIDWAGEYEIYQELTRRKKIIEEMLKNLQRE